MPQVITYTDQNGRRAVLWPAPGVPLTLAQLAAKDVPAGLSWQIVDSDNLPPSNEPPPVPAAVRRLQAKIVLGRSTLSGGVLTIHATAQTGSLLTAANAIVRAAGGEVLLAWTEGTDFFRASPNMVGIGAALGLTPVQLDTLFIAAAQVAL